MSAAVSDEVADQVAVGQGQVADQIQRLMAHAFVVVAQLVVDRPVRVGQRRQMVTALPDTLTPSSPGTIETVKWLGRPISTPWTISNEAGAVISPRARR